MDSLDVLKTLYTIEKASKGFDITKITIKDITEEKTGDCIFKIEETLLSPLGLFYPNIFRNLKTWEAYSDEALKELTTTEPIPVINVSSDIFRDTAKLLKDSGVVLYEGVSPEFLDKNFLSTLEKIRSEWDYKKLINCPLRDLTIEKTDTDFKTLLALVGYPIELAQQIYEHYKVGKQYPLAAFKGFTWENNRLIIPLNEADKYELSKSSEEKAEAIVISTNPYDFFFCSYGNAFQSCFALNSTGSSYFTGFVPKSITGEAFMIYTTNGKTVDVSMTQGHKMQIPQMYSRCWAYLDTKRHLLIDKPYGSHTLYKFAGVFLRDKFKASFYYDTGRATRKLYGDGKGILDLHDKYQLPAYYDSLKFREDRVDFRYSSGDCGYGSSRNISFKKVYNARSFVDFASSVKQVSKIDFSKEHVITDTGTLTIVNRCPVTNFLIDAEETQHPFAKHFPCVSSKSLCITYVDGYFGMTAHSFRDNIDDIIRVDNEYVPCISNNTLYIPHFGKGSMCKQTALKALKEFLKGNINKSVYDVVLLRIVENDKVTFQVFKNIKK